MIEIEDLTMDYGSFRALDHLNLSIPQGEFFALLGPNGAGKTTAIKLLTGLMSPVEGSVKLGGFDVQTQPIEAKSLLGYVPDVAIFYEKLTPREFMHFIADVFHLDIDQAETDSEALFDKFQLQTYAHQRIENLSHGTRQRLAIASALLHRPKVLVIDEPMVGLDPIHSQIVKKELKQRSREGMTVLMSTHLLNIAEELADRIGVINQGKLIELGTLAEIRKARMQEDSHLEDLFLSMISDSKK